MEFGVVLAGVIEVVEENAKLKGKFAACVTLAKRI